jgi:hypothetical protein
MGCCGGTGGGSMTISQADIDKGLRLEIEYTGGRTIRVQGSVTGSEYVFSGLQRLQRVDPRDAIGLLNNRIFRLKGISQGVN